MRTESFIPRSQWDVQQLVSDNLAIHTKAKTHVKAVFSSMV